MRCRCNPLATGREADFGPEEVRANAGAMHGALQQDSALTPTPCPAGTSMQLHAQAALKFQPRTQPNKAGCLAL